MTEVPALTGTSYERMLESVRFSERNRVRVFDALERACQLVAHDLEARHRASGMRPPTQTQINVAGEDRAKKMSDFTVGMSNERWGVRMAVMYGIAELVDAQRETNNHLAAIVDHLEATRYEGRRAPGET